MVYKSKIEKQQVNPSSIVKERWHAVSIVGASDACPSVRAGAHAAFSRKMRLDYRWLTCAWPLNCRCVYRHYADRRATPRRASELGRPSRAVDPSGGKFTGDEQTTSGSGASV